MKIRYVLGTMAVVYLLNYAFYPAMSAWWSEIDVPMHFFGGFLAGLLGLACWEWVQTQARVKNMPLWVVAFLTICFAAFIATSWELYEFSVDLWHKSRGIISLTQQPSVADTMADLALGLVGAAVSTLTLRQRDPA